MSANPKAETLAEHLVNNIERIVSLWMIRTRQEISAARKEDRVVLRDEIPRFLGYLAKALDGVTENSEVEELRIKIRTMEVAKEHGSQRAETGSYTLSEAIFEYQILRIVLFQVLDEYRPVEVIEREIIVSAIEYAVQYMAAQFAKSEMEAYDLFVLTLVHDLRGPLNNASMAAQLLKRPTKPDSAANTLLLLEQNLQRLDKMTTNLLDLRKLSSGERANLKFDDTDLVAILYSVTEELNIGTRLRTVSPKSLKGYWSHDGIQRVIENLISNALKYGKPDSLITVTIEDCEIKALISVHNVGTQIPETDQTDIFKPYFQSQSNPGAGWGVGLALVKRIVDLHNGSINVASSDKEGTTFTIELPKNLLHK